MSQTLDESLDALREEHPYFCEVVLRAPDLRQARHAAQELLQRTAEPLRAAGHRFSAADASIARGCLGVLGDVFSERGEALAGSSALATIKRLLASGVHDAARPAFTEDLRHLLRGAQAKARAGESERPAYLDGGPGARRSRTAYLDRVARQAREGLDAHPCGLDPELAEARRALERRWLERAGRPDADGWHAELAGAGRDPAVLHELVGLERSEREGLAAAAEAGYPIRLSPRMVSLLGLGEASRALRPACLPTAEEVAAALEGAGRSDLLARRGPSAARLSPLVDVPSWQLYGGAPLVPEGPASNKEIGRALDHLAEQAEVRELRLAGCEPFLLSDRIIGDLLARLAEIEHLERVVIKTRFLAALPSRFTETLCERVFAASGRIDLRISARFLTALEITPATAAAVTRLARAGVTVHAEAPLDLGTGRRFAPAALRRALARAGVQSCSFRLLSARSPVSRRVPLSRALMESEEEARRLPGLERFGRVSVTTAEGERRTLQRRRDRQPIGLLPSGERVYEFLSRDRELVSSPRRRYVDVPILDYLTRLAAMYGEDPADYRTLWYYF